MFYYDTPVPKKKEEWLTERDMKWFALRSDSCLSCTPWNYGKGSCAPVYHFKNSCPLKDVTVPDELKADSLIEKSPGTCPHCNTLTKDCEDHIACCTRAPRLCPLNCGEQLTTETWTTHMQTCRRYHIACRSCQRRFGVEDNKLSNMYSADCDSKSCFVPKALWHRHAKLHAHYLDILHRHGVHVHTEVNEHRDYEMSGQSDSFEVCQNCKRMQLFSRRDKNEVLKLFHTQMNSFCNQLQEKEEWSLEDCIQHNTSQLNLTKLLEAQFTFWDNYHIEMQTNLMTENAVKALPLEHCVDCVEEKANDGEQKWSYLSLCRDDSGISSNQDIFGLVNFATVMKFVHKKKEIEPWITDRLCNIGTAALEKALEEAQREREDSKSKVNINRLHRPVQLYPVPRGQRKVMEEVSVEIEKRVCNIAKGLLQDDLPDALIQICTSYVL